MRKPPIMVDCKTCGTPFKVFLSATVRRQYCSHACKSVAIRARAMVTFKCQQCGAETQRKRHEVKGRRFCSSKCWSASVGDGRHHTKRGYVRICVGGVPDIAEHRHVMEKKIGRKLRAGEIVHHKNGIRSDNSPDNLELWLRKDPPGQRVADRIAWAKALLAEYGEMPRPVTPSEALSGLLSFGV